MSDWILKKLLGQLFPEDTTGGSIESAQEAEYLLRCDVGAPVDAEQYPDGVYWRFEYKDLAAKKIIVEGSKVIEIDDGYREHDGDVVYVVRKAKP